MRISAAVFAICVAVTPVYADDPLLAEAVEFTGQIFHLSSGVPGIVIAAVRHDNHVVFGFGETVKGGGETPNADTRIDIASITKTFTGLALAKLVTDGKIALTDPVEGHIDGVHQLPTQDGHAIRMIDLATHSSGLVRELRPIEGVEKYSDASFAGNLSGDPLLFAPGTGILYSNFGFDLLAMALANIAGKSYAEFLQAVVLDALNLTSTSYARPTGTNVFVGYDWNGDQMKPGNPGPNQFGAGSLITTAGDMVKYLKWNLDRFGGDEAEMRALSHSGHVFRDGLAPVYGMDESGHMDAMGLGWVIMMPEGDRPLIVQKAGGADGVFTYIAFAPSRGVGVFIAINQFNFSAAMEMASVVNELIATLSPR